MKFLKGFALAILGFLLFLSLSVFGLAFMLKSTFLNPDFVVAEVDKLDLSAIAGEFIQGQVSGGTEEEARLIKETLNKVITDLEPQLKEQLNGAIYSGYDYLLDKTDRLSITVSLSSLKAGLKDSLTQAFNDYLSSDISALPAELIEPYLEQNYQDVLKQIPPEYLPPELAGMSGDQLKLYIEQNYKQLIQKIPPEQLKPLTDQLKTQLQPYIDEYYDAFASEVPDSYTVDESSVPADAMQAVAQVKQVIGYFQTGYYVLIAFMVLLVGLIILIHRSVRDAARSLGIDLLLCGVLDLAIVLVSRYFMPDFMSMIKLPDALSSLQTWIEGLSNDLLAPAQTFAIGVLVAGVVLLVVSFIVKPRVAEEKA